jgi:putative redox protein
MTNQIKIHVDQISGVTSEAALRGHKVLVDRPLEKGGGDLGPMGGELFLASVGGCFMSTLLAAIRTRDVEISNVRTEVVGTIAGSPACFSAVELHVTADCSDRELLERLVEIANRGCIMMNTLRGKLDVKVCVGVPV